MFNGNRASVSRDGKSSGDGLHNKSVPALLNYVLEMVKTVTVMLHVFYHKNKEKKPRALYLPLPYPPIPPALGSTNQLSVPQFAYCEHFLHWNPVICGLLHLATFT